MNPRQKAIFEITSRKPEYFQYKRPVPEFFGENVFDVVKQKEYLDEATFKALQEAIHSGKPLGDEVANRIASKMKDWAIKRGATHFCHWFQPLTDLTAEKHDALFTKNGIGAVISHFDGSMLVRGEPDASSFPSGGLRTTFEARGYTAWDPSSPAFVFRNTLLIPSLFLSWKGDALDKKTPLLRSMDALNNQALRILRIFGDKKSHRVIPTLAGEQEYFLVDKLLYSLRPDLVNTGRTLFGAQPPKGQELEDQYFGVIPTRILSVMEELEYELMRLGVPIQTRHNEVAPSQYEIALHYEMATLAADHNMLLMELLCAVADRNQMTCLLHEKPFAHVNGSGKHCNWSLATDGGVNLLEPGDSPEENAQFLLFCAAVLRAVFLHAPLLRMAIASASNDHRLGMNEAPPGIVSVFLGEQLHDVFEQLMLGEKKAGKKGGQIKLGVSMLPPIPCHTSDRNRTSPFAFTGNKFEFRAVGSLANLSKPVTVLNTAVAHSLEYFADQLENAPNFHEALHKLLAQETKQFWPIVFEGDNYSEKWREEAVKRGLPNILDCPEAAKGNISPEAIALFEHFNVYSQRELHSRYEIMLEKYVTHIGIEARTASQIVHTQIFPAVIAYIDKLGSALKVIPKFKSSVLSQIEEELEGLQKRVENLDGLMPHRREGDLEQQAAFARDHVLKAMNQLRYHVDALELLIDDTVWPLPKYHEILFIR